ncbi:unnamed protein product [Linum tenue]|uniref:RING-type E3 ubiquitin transferase n=1 Tax=Linum tenue TaxID=586396 RepID=A0AAV0MWW8_9ROSI|nr:unnamed protein product [Linum tenue]
MPGGGGGAGAALLPDHATPTAGLLLQLVRDITLAGGSGSASTAAAAAPSSTFRKDSTDLVRRISLLAHFLEEIADFVGESGPLDCDAAASSSSASWCSALLAALQSAKRLLLVSGGSKSSNRSDGAHRKIALQFQSVTCKLEKALADIPFDRFNISEEVQEQVALVRSQLQRASERYRFVNAETISPAAAPSAQQPLGREIDPAQRASSNGSRLNRSWKIENVGSVNRDSAAATVAVESNDADQVQAGELTEEAAAGEEGEKKKANSSGIKSLEDLKKADAPTIPDDFLCPISLELMRDPVIVATGQTYERSFIQRWVDAGNMTCPKTQQKLEHSTLTPNYVLRSLIAQWCTKHNIEQPTGFTNGRIKKGIRGCDVSGDIAAVQALVRKLSSRSLDERRAAVHEIRTLSKRSTDNRILIAEAGAIPVLVGLLTAEDVVIQENAVTSILNLSIYENNKGLIMLAGAIPSIVQVLRAGSVEAKENAAATVFSLSLGDENKIIIGASGAIPALVELLEHGSSSRGRKDAASALFNLCIYQGNKGRAVRAGIVPALLRMLRDHSRGGGGGGAMVDEALTILSVLSSNVEAKAAIVKASTIPVLIDLLRTGQGRGKENAASILLSLCKRDAENLGCLSRLGAVIPLTELAKSGTERAKRKAGSLLEHIRKLHPH